MYTLLNKHFYLVNRKLTDFVFFWGEMDNTELLAVKKKKKKNQYSEIVPPSLL